MELQHPRNCILRHWADTPDQHRKTNRLYRRMRMGEAHRELSRNKVEMFWAPSYARVTCMEWARRFRDTVLPKGAHLWYKYDDGLRWLGEITSTIQYRYINACTSGSCTVALGSLRDNGNHGIFSGKFLGKEYCGVSGFENSWVVVQGGTENYSSTVDEMRW